MKRNRTKVPLYAKILIGMVAGIAVGFVLLWANGETLARHWLVPWGGLFIRLLQLIAIPLVFVSLVKGVIGLGEIKRFSRMGGRTIAIYMLTTTFAVLLGVGLTLTVKPGTLFNREKAGQFQQRYKETVEEKQTIAQKSANDGPLSFLEEVVPNNIVSAMSDNRRMLQVIFFAILLGLGGLMAGEEKTKPIVRLFDSLFEVLLKVIEIVISCAPVGVAALMVGLVLDFSGDLSVFGALGLYSATVIFGLLFIILLVYPTLIHLFTTRTFGRFVRSVYPLQLFAFTTSSSAASLPVTFDTVERRLGVSNEVASFVLPIGATINMDGTSLYQSVAVLFIAQVLGIELSLMQILVVVYMTILSSIGTPSIPGGSYVVLTMVLASVGIPAEGLALILGVDRPLDMLRTAVNVTGDAVVSVIMDEQTKKAV